uniref:Uncharacterized protein n=1 Tax=Utricularia reniformis TaxID=192314 RepID=A0A1Y0B2C2_9LAMI|nr:hypothetical protein AEK19_MT1397 [Utricularia reniformis]ART31592.1 hypothetical protein AEK19_MT1397 [Utricularia reniformis]
MLAAKTKSLSQVTPSPPEGKETYAIRCKGGLAGTQTSSLEKEPR